jgi:hypothetical protein
VGNDWISASRLSLTEITGFATLGGPLIFKTQGDVFHGNPEV